MPEPGNPRHNNADGSKQDPRLGRAVHPREALPEPTPGRVCSTTWSPRAGDVAYDLRPPSGPAQHHWERDRLAPLGNALTDRAREQCVIRAGLTGGTGGTHLTFAQMGLTEFRSPPAAARGRTKREDPGDLYRRYLLIVLDGLRAVGVAKPSFPVDALTTEDTHTVLQRR